MLTPESKVSIRTHAGEVFVAVNDNDGRREQAFPVPYWPTVRKWLEERLESPIVLREGKWSNGQR